MKKELVELMQISTICENKVLSQMLEDIEPIKEKRFTDIELEAIGRKSILEDDIKKGKKIIYNYKEKIMEAL